MVRDRAQEIGAEHIYTLIRRAVKTGTVIRMEQQACSGARSSEVALLARFQTQQVFQMK